MERCSAANLLFVQPYIFSTRSSVVQRQSTMTYTRQLSKSHRAELKLYIYIYISLDPGSRRTGCLAPSETDIDTATPNSPVQTRTYKHLTWPCIWDSSIPPHHPLPGRLGPLALQTLPFFKVKNKLDEARRSPGPVGRPTFGIHGAGRRSTQRACPLVDFDGGSLRVPPRRVRAETDSARLDACRAALIGLAGRPA